MAMISGVDRSAVERSILLCYVFQDHVYGGSVRDSVTAEAGDRLTDVVIEANQCTTEFCARISGLAPNFEAS